MKLLGRSLDPSNVLLFKQNPYFDCLNRSLTSQLFNLSNERRAELTNFGWLHQFFVHLIKKAQQSIQIQVPGK